MGCTCSRAAKLTLSPLPPLTLGSWRGCCCASFLVGLICFNYISFWVGAARDKRREERRAKKNIGRAGLAQSTIFGPSGMRGHEGGRGEQEGGSLRPTCQMGAVVVMALGSVMLCCPRRGAGSLGELGYSEVSCVRGQKERGGGGFWVVSVREVVVLPD